MSVSPGVTQRTLILDGREAAREEDLRVEALRQEVLNLETQLADLEQKSARSSPLLRSFGRQFGFGAAGKISWVRFKHSYLKEEQVRLAVGAGPGSR